MSVLIKGMKMPEGCGECRFSGAEYCYAKGDENPKSKLPCPLVDQCCVSTMNNDLISKSHFDKRVREAVGMTIAELTADFKDGVRTTLELLKTEPTVDAVPVKVIEHVLATHPERLKGEWKIKKSSIHPYGNDVCCSICGHTMGSSFGYKFCPMCGADMRGEQDG